MTDDPVPSSAPVDFEALGSDAASAGRRLTVLFVLSVVLVAVVTAAAVSVATLLAAAMLGLSVLGGSAGEVSGAVAEPPVALAAWVFALTAVAVGGLIATLTVQRSRVLRRTGGRAIARRLGGRRIDPDSATGAELRFANAVAEIAVAASRPTPEVWVLDREHAINLFNAGWSDDTTVIGITSGAVVGLDRDELQAVAAQAMSHVLHGDARLNLRLMAMVTGIAGLVIVGEDLIERARHLSTRRRAWGSRSDSSALALYLIGYALVGFGWIGVFLASSIQQSIAGRHELLADATAVALTRDPEAMRDALRRIGGHPRRGRIGHHARRTLNHLFLVDTGNRRRGAIHPDLALRISRLDPAWSGGMLEPVARSDGAGDAATGVRSGRSGGEPEAPATVDDPLGLVQFDLSAPFEALGAVTGALGAAEAVVEPAFVDAVSQPTVDAVAAGRRDRGELPPAIAAASWSPGGCRALLVAVAGRAAGVDDPDELLDLATRRGLTEPDLDRHLPAVVGALAEGAGGDEVSGAEIVALAGGQVLDGDEATVGPFREVVSQLLSRVRGDSIEGWVIDHLVRARIERRSGPRRGPRDLDGLRGPYAEVLTFVAVVGRSRLATAVSVGGYAAGLGVVNARNPGQIDLRSVDRALSRLRRLDEPGRQRAVDGLLACIDADSRATRSEIELVQALAAAIGAEPPVTAG